MKTNQPKWFCVANLGDADPINYGGAFVYVDLTGVYDPELEILREPIFSGPDDKPQDDWRVYRVCLESHTYTAENAKGERVTVDPSMPGVLSDNAYHPECAAWYSDTLADIAYTVGCEPSDLIARFCSDDPIMRASAYLDAIARYGAFEFDHYPIELGRNASRVAFRYRSESKQLRTHRHWRVGYLVRASFSGTRRFAIVDRPDAIGVDAPGFSSRKAAREYARENGIALIEKQENANV